MRMAVVMQMMIRWEYVMTGTMGIRDMSPGGGSDGTDEGSRGVDEKAVVDSGVSSEGISNTGYCSNAL